MAKLKVNRRFWRRGGNNCAVFPKHTKLLAEDNLMCILGFACVESGVTHENLLNKGTPMEVLTPGNDPFQLLHDDNGTIRNSKFAKRAMIINDVPTVDTRWKDEPGPIITEEEREDALIKLFAAAGHTLSFSGKG